MSPITHDSEHGSFDTEVEGVRATLDYHLAEGRAVMTHVRVPPSLEGRGIAGALTREALDWARAQGFDVEPRCPYVAAWIGRHPEYADLVAQ